MRRFAICTSALVCIPVLVVSACAESLQYPQPPREDVVDDYHGHRVADPYRWMEDTDTRNVSFQNRRTWVLQEARLTNHYLESLPGRDGIRQRLEKLSEDREVGVPWREAGKLFWTETGHGPQGVLYTMDEPGGKPRVFFDPNRISPDGSVAMGDFLVSPDGRHLAYRAAEGGRDRGEIRVRDVSADRDTDDVVQGFNACWTRDARGFFYARSFRKGGDAGSGARESMRGFYHRLGEPQSEDRQFIEWNQNASWAYFMTSEDGRYAALVAEEGSVNEIFMLDLTHSENLPFKILEGQDGIHTPIDWVGNVFYVRTELGAPRRRVIALDLGEGAAAKAREIVPESSDVITDAVITDDYLVINYLSDVHSRLRMFKLNGKPAGEIDLPGIGAVGWPLSARPSVPGLFYSFESFLSPPVVYEGDLATPTPTARVFQRASSTFDANKYETKQIFYPSKDGTRVPMFVTASKSIVLDGSHPVFLTAYGGYGSTMEPHYSPDVPLWLEMGGIYVLANIRGGGEYGEEWHRAGMLEKKQNSFDDFIAAAEYLIKAGYTQSGKIAIYGHSNGGLLVGAVVTQRPDLFGAAVANAGHYDMLRYHRFTAGAGWVSEYGSADDPAQFEYLRAYSPLQNVSEGKCYPATLLLAADHDDRVVPSHSYKFAATLQAAQQCGAPILLRVAKNASHSYSSRAEMIAERTDMWSFIAARLAVSP